MKTNKELIYDYIYKKEESNREKEPVEFTTEALSSILNIRRSNTSRYLNHLVKENRLSKTESRPVRFYLKTTNNEEDAFVRLIGFKESLANQVQLAKAAMLYPEKSLPILIKGPVGSGKSYFARVMFDFLKEHHRVNENAQFVSINILDYHDLKEFHDYLYHPQTGLITQLQDDKMLVIFVKYINRLDVHLREKLFQSLNDGVFIISAVNDDISDAVLESIESKYSVVITLSGLSQRTIKERFQMVQEFLGNEANRMNRSLKLNAELLRCILLYNPENNIEQLKKDIQLGCANAYLKDMNSEKVLNLSLSDFPAYIRKGFLYYKDQKDELEKVIPNGYDYTFSTGSFEKMELGLPTFPKTIYHVIDRKVKEFQNQGMSDEEINIIINENLENDIVQLSQKVNDEPFDTSSLKKIVDPEIVEVVEIFLQESSITLQRIFPESVFYGLSLHIQSMLSNANRKLPNLEDNIMSIITKYPQEYTLSEKFTEEINQKFNAQLPLEETMFIAMFISKSHEVEKVEKPIVIVALHGSRAASSLVEVVKSLMKVDNVFAFDLDLELSMTKAYEQLKFLIIEKQKNKGVLIIYDMGSIRTMAETIASEINVDIKTIAVPLTLMALDASRKAETLSLDELYRNVVESYTDNLVSIRENFEPEKANKAIITLCMTGQGSAVQIMKYLNENLTINNLDVIPLSISNRDKLIKEVNKIYNSHDIISIVGTYDPKLFNIPFVPISRLFETHLDKLELLLSLDEKVSGKDVDYNAIYSYLSEQLEDFDIELLKEQLPKVIRQIKRLAKGLTLDQELGLFMHIATNIHRLQHEVKSVSNYKTNLILNRNKKLYNNLQDIMKVIEYEFSIEFGEDDFANIICIIKQDI